MNNNRLTNEEICALRETIEELRRLSSLETASFCSDIEKDKNIKSSIKPYMCWFNVEANKIEEILNGQYRKWK